MAGPSRRQRQSTVYTIVAGPILFIGLWIMFQFNITNIYYLIGLVIFAVVMGAIASSFVPDMRRKENKNRNMYTGLPNRSKREINVKKRMPNK